MTVATFLQALTIVLALSADAFVSGFSYGANKIKIPLSSLLVIDVTCSAVLYLSLLLGSLVGPYFSPAAAKMLCFSILFCLAITKIFDSTVKAFIKKHTQFNRQLKFSLFSLRFVLDVYANPPQADIDNSKTLSAAEALFLAVALSLDSLAVGFGAGMIDTSPLLIVVLSLLVDIVAILAGQTCGRKITHRFNLDLNWLSGLLLLCLAVLKLA